MSKKIAPVSEMKTEELKKDENANELQQMFAATRQVIEFFHSFKGLVMEFQESESMAPAPEKARQYPH